VSSIPLIAKHAQAAQIEQHLLSTVGVASEDATTTDLMLAVAQLAREQLSQRWSIRRPANAPPSRAGWSTCRWSS